MSRDDDGEPPTRLGVTGRSHPPLAARTRVREPADRSGPRLSMKPSLRVLVVMLACLAAFVWLARLRASPYEPRRFDSPTWHR